MVRMRNWLAKLTPGEILQVATAFLALLATTAAAAAAISAYMLNKSTEDRVSSAVIEVSTPQGGAGIAGSTVAEASAIYMSLSIRNIGGVAAVVTSVAFRFPEDEDCLSPPDSPPVPLWKRRKTEPELPIAIQPGAAVVIELTQAYMPKDLGLCSESSLAVLDSPTSHSSEELGVYVAFSNGEILLVPGAATRRREDL